ncbi:MAG: hypothetical protein LBG75_01615 [Candidatus Nomurabacteria bacterium]|nr:hypothetical protein [Candidatus Nomurabacteria bacterium]
MAKITKVIAGVSVLGMLGVAALPLSSYAVTTGTTTVNVEVGSQCGIGEGSTTGGAATVDIGPLSSTNQSGENSTAGAASPISVTCNNATGWSLTEQMNTGEDQILNIGGLTASTTGFGPWTGGTAVTGFAANTWGAKYAAGGSSGAGSYTVVTAAQTYHAVPANGSPTNVATASNATSNSTVTQTFGANTNGSLGAGTYTGIVLYTLTPAAP